MKNLQNYIREKLLVNKNLKRVLSDIEDFNDVTEVFAIGFDYEREYFFINKYNVVTINRYDHSNDDIEYIITAKSNLYSLKNMHAKWIEDSKVLYTLFANKTKYIFIHPKDKERLDKLYYFVKQLRSNERYSLQDILNKKLNIGTDFLENYSHSYLECLMIPEDITDMRMKIAKAWQQL